MAKYVGVTILHRGVLRSNGKRRLCMHPGCNAIAIVRAFRTKPHRLEVAYCMAHAEQGGIVRCPLKP